MPDFTQEWWTKVGEIEYNPTNNTAWYVAKTTVTKVPLPSDDINLELRYIANKIGSEYRIAIDRTNLSLNDTQPGETKSSPWIFLVAINLSQLNVQSREDYDRTFVKSSVSPIEELVADRLSKAKHTNQVLQSPYKSSEQIKSNKLVFPSAFSEIGTIPQQLTGATREHIVKQSKTLEGLYENVVSKLNFKNLKSFTVQNISKYAGGDTFDVECLALDISNEFLCAQISDPGMLPKNAKGQGAPGFRFNLDDFLNSLVFDFFGILEKTVHNIVKELIANYIRAIIRAWTKFLDQNMNVNRYISPCNDNMGRFNDNQQRRLSLGEVINLQDKDFKETFKSDMVARNFGLGYDEYLIGVDKTLAAMTPREMNGLYNKVIAGEALDKIKDIFDKITGKPSDNDGDYIDLFSNYRQFVNFNSMSEENRSLYIFNCNHTTFFDIQKEQLLSLGHSSDSVEHFIETRKAALKETAKLVCDFLQRKATTVVTKEEPQNSDIVKKTLSRNIDTVFDSIEKSLRETNSAKFRSLSILSGELTLAAYGLYRNDEDYESPPPLIFERLTKEVTTVPPGLGNGNYYINQFENRGEEQTNFYEKYVIGNNYRKIDSYKVEFDPSQAQWMFKTDSDFDTVTIRASEMSVISDSGRPILVPRTENAPITKLSSFLLTKLKDTSEAYQQNIIQEINSENKPIEELILNEFYLLMNNQVTNSRPGNNTKKYYILDDFFLEDIVRGKRENKDLNKYNFSNINFLDFTRSKQDLRTVFKI